MNIVTLLVPVCPHCGSENTIFQLLTQFQDPDISPFFYQLWACGHCKTPACSYSTMKLTAGGHKPVELCAFYPVPGEVLAPEGTPPAVASAFRSAKRYLKLGKDADYEAACVMARRAIELAVNDLGAEGKNLFQKIENLETRRLIPPVMRDWAHHLREIGNRGAHGDTADRKDASQAVYFAEMLFTYLFTLPRLVQKYRQDA